MVTDFGRPSLSLALVRSTQRVQLFRKAFKHPASKSTFSQASYKSLSRARSLGV